MAGNMARTKNAPEDLMITDRFRAVLLRSLRVKVTAGVITILAIAMSAVFVVQYRWFQREMMERLGLASTPLSDVIKGSLKHAMQTRDPSEVAAIIENVSRQKGVIKVFIVDKKGEIRASPVREEIGRMIPPDDPTCLICHRVQADNRQKTVVFTAPGGERIFRNVNPIANEPECVRCHGPKDRLNGVLISDFSMAEVDRQLATASREMLLGLVLTVGATALGIALIMNRLVIAKLERFVHATKLLGRGRLDLHVSVGAPDEIGELAASFNGMIDGLRRTKELRERQELLEHVLDNVDDSVLVFAPEGSVIAVNRGAEVAFGVASGEVIGKPAGLFGADHAVLLERAARDGAFTVELRLRSREGRWFPALVHLAPLRDERGELLACVAVAQDLTEERVKERLQEQLAQSEKLAAVGRLAAGVAHELNNPLGNVLMYSKLLMEDCPPPDPHADAARHIVDNTLRCKRIVRSLLDYAKESQVRMAWTDLNHVVEQSVDLVAGDLSRRQIACDLDLPAGLPKVRCDTRQVQQVLVNLLQNAIDAVDGDGRVRVFTGAAGDDAVVLGVRDNGSGIPADSLSRVFEPFYTTKERGTGLGLSICYGIVERHQGKIWVESATVGGERGSTFFVTLPVTGEGPA
jgi:PAS domain S-box-containing protein